MDRASGVRGNSGATFCRKFCPLHLGAVGLVGERGLASASPNSPSLAGSRPPRLMAATIHPLFAGPAETRPPALSAVAEHPLVGELRAAGVARMAALLDRMFEDADDALFEMGERAATDGERRSYLDTMRALRIDRRAVAARFTERFAEGYAAVDAPRPAAPAASPEALSIQPTEELEERIALGNLATKIEAEYRPLLWPLERRLAAARVRGLPLNPACLSPARICACFGEAAAVMATEFRIKLVVFKLFDRVLSRALGPLFVEALQQLEAAGVGEERPATAPETAPHSAPAAPLSPLAQLRRLGLDPARLHLDDSPEAAPVLDWLGQLFAQGDAGSIGAAVQRLSMAGQWFEQTVADPMAGARLRAAFEPLRQPVYRTALSDPGFLDSAAHPLRRMLAELVALGAAVQTGEVPDHYLHAGLSSWQARVEQRLSAAAPLPLAMPDLDSLERFLADLDAQSRQRRRALLLQVRRLVAQEIDLRTITRRLPPAVLSLLRSGISPLLALRLLRHGRDSTAFAEALSLLDRTVEAFDAAPAGADLAALSAALAAAFRSIGMHEPRIAALLGGLCAAPAAQAAAVGESSPPAVADDARHAAPAPAPEAPAPATRTQRLAAASEPGANGSLISKLAPMLVIDSWFRVYDAAQDQTRWLRLASVHPAQDRICFAGFDEATHLSLRASRLAEDLVEGRSEPINPGPAAQAALAALRAASVIPA